MSNDERMDQALQNLSRYRLPFPAAGPRERPSLYGVPRLVMDRHMNRWRLTTDDEYSKWPAFGDTATGLLVAVQDYRLKREVRDVFMPGGQPNKVVCVGWDHGGMVFIGHGAMQGQSCMDCPFSLPQGSVDVPLPPSCMERTRVLMLTTYEAHEDWNSVFWFLDVPTTVTSIGFYSMGFYHDPAIYSAQITGDGLKFERVSDSVDPELITEDMINNQAYSVAAFNAMGVEYAAMVAEGVEL